MFLLLPGLGLTGDCCEDVDGSICRLVRLVLCCRCESISFSYTCACMSQVQRSWGLFDVESLRCVFYSIELVHGIKNCVWGCC